MSRITVIDSIMGSGKTSWAIQAMNAASGPWLYITPYLDEVQRIVDSCPGRAFQQPQADSNSNKSDDLFKLASEGKNIASTHELFKRIDQDTMEMIRLNGYSLVMDEVLEVIQPLGIKPISSDPLFTKKVLEPESKNKSVCKIFPGPEQDLNGFYVMIGGRKIPVKEIRQWAEADRLVQVNGNVLLWLFPAHYFEAFKRIYNLTYLFDGSYTKALYDLNGFSYEYRSAGKLNGKWTLLDKKAGASFPSSYDPLIDIYSGKLNAIGDPANALSHTWWGKGREQKEAIMRRRLESFFRNNCGSQRSAGKALWTCFKQNKEGLKGRGYSRGWAPHNQRATNAYRPRSNLAYVINRWMNPQIKGFFDAKGVSLDENKFALSELLQWLWRSRLRDHKTINLYLPSARMRGILEGWISQN